MDFPALPNRLRETAPQERPQERLLAAGPAALSDAELVALLLRSGTRGLDVITLANRLLQEAGSLGGLLSWSPARFRRCKGIGAVKATQLVAVMEITRRVLSQEAIATPLLDHAESVSAYLSPFAVGLEVEKFWVLCLNRKGRLLKRVEATSGTASSTLVHPREVFREAVREGASSIICAHNHPSGDPSPSAQDIRVTRSLREAAGALDIPLLDHVILGRRGLDPAGLGFYSFRSAGHL